MNHDLTRAFPPTPDACRSAFMTAVRSVKEDEPMRRKYPVAIVIAAILTLMTTVAIAEGWNVLQFLGLQPDSDATQLVQPVSVSGKAGNVTLTIDSALTDGEYLVFDYTLTNADPDRPAFLNVEELLVGGSPNIYFAMTEASFDDQWLPGTTNPATLTGGCIIPLKDWAWMPELEDTLHIDLTVGVHTAVKPAVMLDAYDTEKALAALNADKLVIVGNDKYAEPLPPESIGYLSYRSGLFGSDATVYGTEHTAMTLSFDLDMKAAHASLQHPDFPHPAYAGYTKLELERFTVSPLQIRITAVATWADDAPAGLTGKFLLRDREGKTIKVKSVSASPETYAKTLGRDDPFTNKQTVWECAIIAPNASLPDEADLVFRLTDGTEAVLPLTFR